MASTNAPFRIAICIALFLFVHCGGTPDSSREVSMSDTASHSADDACAPTSGERTIQLVRAEATGDCFDDDDACGTVTYHLAVWIDLANLAYAKTVTLVYRAHPSDAWSRAAAHYFGAGDSGREIWYGETPSIDLAANDDAAIEFSLEYGAAGATYVDDAGGEPYVLAASGAGARSTLLGHASVALTSATLDSAGTLTGTALVRREAVTSDGAVSVVYTTDDWAHVEVAAAIDTGAPATCDADVWSFTIALGSSFEKVAFAIRYGSGDTFVWDNNFGRNYARYTPLQGFGGRWDVTVTSNARTFPSWFELTNIAGELRGRWVGRVGSARPIRDIDITAGTLSLALVPQYETQPSDVTLRGALAASALSGTCSSDDGAATFTARPAPAASTSEAPTWGEASALLPGTTLQGWTARDPSAPNAWQFANGVLTNASPGTDLVTTTSFTDFKLHLEFNLPPSGNSGIFLRGRYEVQIEDDQGLAASTLRTGAIYGFLAPTVNAALAANTWQSCDVTLIGRTVTVIVNGVTVVDAREIPGITGGALDSDEGAAGPIVLQGDHTGVAYRNVTIRTPM